MQLHDFSTPHKRSKVSNEEVDWGDARTAMVQNKEIKWSACFQLGIKQNCWRGFSLLPSWFLLSKFIKLFKSPDYAVTFLQDLRATLSSLHSLILSSSNLSGFSTEFNQISCGILFFVVSFMDFKTSNFKSFVWWSLDEVLQYLIECVDNQCRWLFTCFRRQHFRQEVYTSRTRLGCKKLKACMS